MLDRSHPPRRVALAVAQPFDLVDDRDLRIAGQNEIAMQRMRQPVFDGTARGHHGLPDHLPAKYPLPARLRAVAAKHVHLECFEVENGNEVDQSFGHRNTFNLPVTRGTAKPSKFRPSRFETYRISRPRRPGMAVRGPRALVSPSCFAQLYWVARVRGSRSSMSVQRSIVIGGGAFAGLALALAL